jgi:acyl-CoA hydrolase
MPAGALLDMLVIVSGHCAWSCGNYLIATVSIDKINLLMPICHRDLVRVTGQIVSAGSSGINVEVIAQKEDSMRRTFVADSSSPITMVIIDRDTQICAGICASIGNADAREMQKEKQVEK